MTDRRKKQIAIISIAAVVAIFIAAFWFVGRPLVKFVSEPERFRAWVNSGGIWGRIAFIGMIVLQTVIPIIPGEPMEIGAGYAFGTVEGPLLCMLGAVIGGAIVFAFVRKFGIKAVEVFFPKEKIESIGFLKDTKRLSLLVFIVFFIPGTPKDMLAYCVGLTNMKFTVWLAISGIARIPSIITSTIGGDALGMGNHTFAIAVFAFTILLSAIGIYIYRKISKAKTKKEKEDVAKQGLEGSSLIGEETDKNEEQKSKPGEEQASDSIKIADRMDMK